MNPDSSRDLERHQAQIDAYRERQVTRLGRQINRTCEAVISEHSLSRRADKRPIQVVHVRGFVLDITAVNDPFGGAAIIRNVTGLARANGIEANGFSVHRHEAQVACRRLLRTSAESRIFLVGHSMGAAGATAIAECLKKHGRQVEMMVHVSSYHALEPRIDVRRVPSNVRTAYNFSVTDGIVDGQRRISPVDPAKTRVYNSHHHMNLLVPFAGTHAYATSRLAGLISVLGGTKVLYPDAEIHVPRGLPFLFEKRWSELIRCGLRPTESPGFADPQVGVAPPRAGTGQQ